MSKSATAVRYGHAADAAPMARTGAVAPSVGARSARRPLATLAERVKTFLDRTLDVARGRYDM